MGPTVGETNRRLELYEELVRKNMIEEEPGHGIVYLTIDSLDSSTYQVKVVAVQPEEIENIFKSGFEAGLQYNALKIGADGPVIVRLNPEISDYKVASSGLHPHSQSKNMIPGKFLPNSMTITPIFGVKPIVRPCFQIGQGENAKFVSLMCVRPLKF